MKKLSPNARLCPLCARPWKKKGFTSAGSQRWYCSTCRYNFTIKPVEHKRKKHFTQFLAYITDTLPRRGQATLLSTWDRTHAWCWQTKPDWRVSGEVCDQVFIDGTYIAYNWCVLIAASTQGVIAFQLCQHENKASYKALLSPIPAPIVVVTDGAQGALAPIRECWPTTIIQRCLVHIQRNIGRITTLKPKTGQHKALRHRIRPNTRIHAIDEAITWHKALAPFHDLYDPWLNEKTYREQVHPSDVPVFARGNKHWWYTHHQTRRIIRSLDRYVKEGVLFAYLRADLKTNTQIASTTNPLEGAINSPLKAFLYTHQDWPEHHILTAINYWLYTRSLNPKPLESFINNTNHPKTKAQEEPQPEPVEIDTTINTQTPWDDGLHIRKGWVKN